MPELKKREDGRYLLKKAADPAKDQSYASFTLLLGSSWHTPCFRFGDMNKHQTRMIARPAGLL
ncbi:MAG: hypothetical protein ACLURP_14805 [Ruminococcus sp.]